MRVEFRSLGAAFTTIACAALGSSPCNAQATAADLDATVQRVLASEHVAGASVLVMRGDKVLLHKGYGVADVGLEAPTKSETVYHVVGPMLPFTGVAVLQLMERGKLSLDDEVSRFIPEFPMQGRHVTIRQLLDHTSGIVDYHYLGDPIESTSRLPKALDEVMALYAGKAWVNEPGVKWDWSISGFQLLVTVVERVSGLRFADYMQQNLFAPAGLTSTTYCDDRSTVRGLSHAYRRYDDRFVAAKENDMAYNADLRFCSTVGDLYKLWTALTTGKLLKAATFQLMTTSTGAASRMNAQDPKAQYGLALSINVVERVSGLRFADYMQQNLFAPAGLTSTTYCDDRSTVRGLSHAYRRYDDRFVAAKENDMAYNADLRFCSTVGDLYKLWTALTTGKLLKAATFQLMTTSTGAASRMNAQDPKAQYGLALSINHEEAHTRYGQHGSLFGYSGSLYEFPGDKLTVVVLSNTEGQNAYAITRGVARAVLDLPALPTATPRPPRVLSDVSISAEQRTEISGTYVLKLDRFTEGLHDSYAQYTRTYRVFDENGRMMIQVLGEGPDQLLKQDDGSYAMRAAPRNKLTFAKSAGGVMSLKIDSQSLPLWGTRVGAGDPKTFHLQRN